MSQIEFKYIHFWKGEIPYEELELWLEKTKLYNKRAWLILLDEKLRRNEL